MAKVRVTRTICDVCGTEDRLAERYIINYPDARIITDLCDQDAAPLLDLRRLLPAPKTSGRRGQREVVSMDQVEAAKPARKRNGAAKKAARKKQ